MIKVLSQALMIYSVCTTNSNAVQIDQVPSLKKFLSAHSKRTVPALFILHQKIHIVFGHRVATIMETMQISGIGGSLIFGWK